MQSEEGLAYSTHEEEEPSSLKVPFTPTHHLRDRFLSFTEFLLGNLEEWSSPQPPWPSPPPAITFSGSDRFFKGRLPHRTMAISASLSSLIGDAMPLSDACKRGDGHVDHDDNLAKMQDVRLDKTLSNMHGATHADDDSAPVAHGHDKGTAASANTLSNSSIQDLSSDNALNFDAHRMRPQADDSHRALSSTELVDASNCGTDNALEVDTVCKIPNDDKLIWGQSSNVAIDVTACGTDTFAGTDPECGWPQDYSVHGLSSNEAVDVAACGTDTTKHIYEHDDGTVLPLHETVIAERLLSTQPGGFDRNVPAPEVLVGSVQVLADASPVNENSGCMQYGGGRPPLSDVSMETLKGGNVAIEAPEDAEAEHPRPLECKMSLLTSLTNVADGLHELTPTKINNYNMLQDTDMEASVTRGFDAQLSDLEEGELSERDEHLDTLEEGRVTAEAEKQERGPLSDTRLERKAQDSTTDDEMDQPISLFVSRYRTRYSVSSSSRKKSPMLDGNRKSMKKMKPSKRRKPEAEEQVLQELVSVDAGITGQSLQVKGIQKGSNKVASTCARAEQQSNIGSGNAIEGKEPMDVQSGLHQLSIGSKVQTNGASEDVETKYVEVGAAEIGGYQVMEASALVLSAHSIQKRAEGASCMPSIGSAQLGLAENEQDFLAEKHKGLLSMVLEEDLATSDAVNDQKSASQKAKVASVKPKRKKRKLTVRRKNKKEEAKLRKRDKRREGLGVCKLKLKPYAEKKKERVMKICHFYAKGKCGKGASCTFSHDITPTTKSEMCKYFKNNCCLKGDDCPYSHALSSFPCKYFHTRGYCMEADSCRFSHEPISEEAKQELHRKIEEQQQIRQGIVKDGMGHVDLKNSEPLNNSKILALGGDPKDKTAEVPVKGSDVPENLRHIAAKKASSTFTVGLTNGANSSSSMRIAAKKAFSTFTVGPTNAANVEMSLLCGGSLETRGPLPSDQCTIPTTQFAEREGGAHKGSGSPLTTAGNPIDRKTKINAFLQSQLDDSQFTRKSKLAKGSETVRGCYSLSDRARALPIKQALPSKMPNMSLSSEWNTKAAGLFQASSDHIESIANLKSSNRADFLPNSSFLIGHQENASNRRFSGTDTAVIGPSVSGPSLLDLISIPQEAAVPKWPDSTSGLLSMKTYSAPKRSTADKILDRFL